MKNENAIDLFKFIFSLLIVAIHVHIFRGNLSEYDSFITNGIARVGVPFLFISGSYFLFKNLNATYSVSCLKKYFSKLLRLYTIWSIIYFFPIMLIAVKNGTSISQLFSDGIQNYLFNGIATHLWYLNTTIICTLFFILIIKQRIRKIVLPLCIVLFICGLLCNAYNKIIMPIENDYFQSVVDFITKYTYSTNFSVPFFWMIFIYIGYLFATDKLKINKRVCLMLLPISFFALYLELWFVDSNLLFYGHSISISILPTSILIFALSLNLKFNDDNIYIYMRHMSTLIYLIHPLILTIVAILFSVIEFDIDISGLLYVVVATLSILLSCIIIKLHSKNERIPLKLSYLYK